MMTEQSQHRSRAEEAGDATSSPARTRLCVGCGQRSAPEELVRVVLGPEGQVAVDMAGGAFGRGAHVHPARSCMMQACRAGLARAFKQKVVATPEDLGAQIVAGCERRVAGLLLGARRANQLAVGADAAIEALGRGAPLLLLATDAATIAKRAEVARAAADGKAVAFGTKQRLGELLGKDEIAVVAVLHAGIADSVSSSVRLAGRVATYSSSSLEDR